jgi:hypothetical protein
MIFLFGIEFMNESEIHGDKVDAFLFDLIDIGKGKK